MLNVKPVISGWVNRIVGNMAIVSDGETTDCYNLNYYSLSPDRSRVVIMPQGTTRYIEKACDADMQPGYVRALMTLEDAADEYVEYLAKQNDSPGRPSLC